MSENNQFEIVMQKRMEEFQVEPAPSDWQAIYDQLHPRKKRRIIWWWFPLVALLGAGIYWASMEKNLTKNGSTVAINSGNNNAVKESNPETTKKNVSGKNDSNAKDGKTSAKNVTIPSVNGASTLPSKNQDIIKTSITRQTKTQTANKKSGTVPQASGLIPSAGSLNEKSALPSKENPGTEPSKQTSETLKPTADPESSVNENNAALKTAPLAPKTGDSIKLVTTADSGKMVNDKAPQLKESTTIPVKNKHSDWQFAAYLGAGPNYATNPVHLMQGGLMADVSTPNSSSGGSRTYTNSNDKGGWHFSAGVAAEKNLGKNWLFMAGLGINSGTWAVTAETYKDSLTFGSLTSTYKLSTIKTKYKLLMAEIPLQFSNRIAGKKSGSLWWTVGINNQFRIKYSQQSTTDSISGAPMADYRVMNSTARFYQPQFRLGLMYNHFGKIHWQLQPLFQYTLTGVYSAGGSDNPVMTNLQIQYRLFLQGKNNGKKSPK